MKVNDLSGALRGIDPRDAQKPEGPPTRRAEKEARTEYGDALDLSVSARASAYSTHETDSAEAGGLTPDRMTEIRQRISSGFYDTPAVSSEIADRVLSFYAR